jgi:predicted MFS family arabinose efflux permease
VVGILGGRAVAGAISSLLDWRAVFVAAALALAAMLPVLARQLPRTTPHGGPSYRGLIVSLPGLFSAHPLVRRACLSGAATGVALLTFWTAAVFMLADRYGWGPAQVGLLALVALASAAVTPLAGRFADRRGTRTAALLAAVAMVASYAAFLGAPDSLFLLLVGTVLLDAGMQANQVINQLSLFTLDPGVTSRVNTIYMLCRYAGMGSGSLLGAAAWLHGGWPAVCAVGGVSALIVVAVHLRDPRDT